MLAGSFLSPESQAFFLSDRRRATAISKNLKIPTLIMIMDARDRSPLSAMSILV